MNDLNPSCRHALSCNIGEATRGHYAVRDDVLQLFSLADSSCAVEVPNLIPSCPGLRPADIFTSASHPGRRAALDIGITFCESSGSGVDCCDSMYTKKKRVYEPHGEELLEGGIVYEPVVFSSYGRLHPRAMLRNIMMH